jgi:competence protein ComEA
MRSNLRAAVLTLCLCAAVAIGAARLEPRAVRLVEHPVHAVDVNRASAEELAALPGLGLERARRIVARRRALGGYRAIDELLSVPGVGPKTLDKLRPALRLGP